MKVFSFWVCRRAGRLALSGSLLCASIAWAAPRASRLAPELSGVAPDASVRVIVQYREEATADRHARTLRRGGRLRQELPLVRGGAYTMTAAQLEELARISHEGL